MDRLILRRGLPESYYEFLRVFAVTRGLVLTIDRRTGDRRQEPRGIDVDRRHGERRAEPPATWRTADFITVEDPKK